MGQPIPLFAGELMPVHQVNALRFQGGQVFPVEQRVLPFHLAADGGKDPAQLLLGGQAGGVLFLVAHGGGVGQGADAHHEKLIQAGAADGKEIAPFQQGIVRIGGLFQYPAVEGEPAQFPVDQIAFFHDCFLGFFSASGGWLT